MTSLCQYIQKFSITKKPFRVMNNNTMQIDDWLKKSKIRIEGKDNSLIIAKGNFKKVKIGIDGNNNTIIIEEACFLRDLELIVQGDNHTISIGKRVEIGGATLVCCGQKSKISIGDDALLASNIDIKTCDGHAIYQNNEIINNSKEIQIANDVWISQDVKILKGVSIASNSVVGIASVVTANQYPSNVVIAGIPAKVIKENITWSRERTL